MDEPEYPFHDKTITVTRCGRICFDRIKINLSSVFAGQNVGVKQVDDKIWLVTVMQYDLGDSRRLGRITKRGDSYLRMLAEAATLQKYLKLLPTARRRPLQHMIIGLTE